MCLCLSGAFLISSSITPSGNSDCSCCLPWLTPLQQPTEFWIDLYNLTHVFDTPRLIQSLASFSEQRQASQSEPREQREGSDKASGTILFLHIRSAADYFTTNKTLMLQPPAVDVDLILDPYLANIFPASLVPTAIYIVVLAIFSYFLSGVIWTWLQPSKLKQHAD